MGQLMEKIHVVARGQEIMAKMQEDMNQQAHVTTLIPNANPPIMENPVPPQGNIPLYILVGST